MDEFRRVQGEQRNGSWSYCQFDSDFVVYNHRNESWVRPILDALIPARAVRTRRRETRAAAPGVVVRYIQSRVPQRWKSRATYGF